MLAKVEAGQALSNKERKIHTKHLAEREREDLDHVDTSSDVDKSLDSFVVTVVDAKYQHGEVDVRVGPFSVSAGMCVCARACVRAFAFEVCAAHLFIMSCRGYHRMFDDAAITPLTPAAPAPSVLSQGAPECSTMPPSHSPRVSATAS